jgi:hypothetical protein
MILHADTIPQNRPARVRACGIDRNDPYGAILLAIMLGQLVNQGALARTRRTGQTQNPGPSRLWKQRFQQFRPARRAVLDDADRPRQSPRIAGTKLLNPWLEVEAQSVSVKQAMKRMKSRLFRVTRNRNQRCRALDALWSYRYSYFVHTAEDDIISNCHGVHMPRSSTARKAKKTFSLSRQSVMYLESLRKEKRSKSVSSVLEDIIRQQQQVRELERISASVTRYYDSLTPEEIAEDRAWGDFAATQFPSED